MESQKARMAMIIFLGRWVVGGINVIIKE